MEAMTTYDTDKYDAHVDTLGMRWFSFTDCYLCTKRGRER